MYTHIIHLADIHIVTDRQDEYRQVFDNTFRKIKELTKNALIIVAGDIIHNKTKITPEVISMTNYLPT